MVTEPTPQQILELPMPENNANAPTIRDYLITLLADLWELGSDFSSKRPFGDTDWQWTIYNLMIDAGWVQGEHHDSSVVKECDRLMDRAIRHLRHADA